MLRTIGRRAMRNRRLVGVGAGLVVLTAAGLWYLGIPPSSTLFGAAGSYQQGGKYSTIEVSGGGCISIRNDNPQQIIVTGRRGMIVFGTVSWVRTAEKYLDRGATRAVNFTGRARVESSNGQMTLVDLHVSGGGCDNWLGLQR